MYRFTKSMQVREYPGRGRAAGPRRPGQAGVERFVNAGARRAFVACS